MDCSYNFFFNGDGHLEEVHGSVLVREPLYSQQSWIYIFTSRAMLPPLNARPLERKKIIDGCLG
jgi:hypothetical protein